MVLATAGLVAASPARAAGSLTVDVTCEGVGRYRVACWRTVSGGTAPYLTKWYFNGNHYAAYDNLVHTSWSCTPNGSNLFTVAVVDGNFEISADTSSASCRGGTP
jgi:hypothetical protein